MNQVFNEPIIFDFCYSRKFFHPKRVIELGRAAKYSPQISDMALAQRDTEVVRRTARFFSLGYISSGHLGHVH